MRVQQAGFIGEVFLDGTWTISIEGQVLDRGYWEPKKGVSQIESISLMLDALEHKIDTFMKSAPLEPVA